MLNLRILFIFIAMLWLSISVFAAEDSEHKNSPKDAPENEQVNTTPTKNSGKRARVKTLEEFIPSEEVSADKPVAFPSDI